MPLPACPRIPVTAVQGIIPLKWIESLEQNQQIAHCCRHPEHHDIEALRSHADESAPNIYIFHCTCGRRHIRFMCSNGVRPAWDVR